MASITDKMFETRRFRAPLEEKYIYDPRKDQPEKVLEAGQYKEYHTTMGCNYSRFEVHQHKPELLECNSASEKLNSCLKTNVTSNDNKEVPTQCRDFMESVKTSCGLRRFGFFFVNIFMSNNAHANFFP